MSQNLPNSVRYVKNGSGGKWWGVAKARDQIHGGWRGVPDDLIERADMRAIEALPTNIRGETKDLNALRDLLVRPSQHLWVTFADGCLWWCTVLDGAHANPSGEAASEGHFWLNCDKPWSCHTLDGRYLSVSNLPGIVTATIGFRGTVCTPGGAAEVLRIVKGEIDSDAAAAIVARKAYEDAVAKLVARLAPQDFELLTDLILARDGWARLGELGGTREGVDLEVENSSANEIAFVQVKSRAGQMELDDYVERFRKRRERYTRMFFVVHSASGSLNVPKGEPVQVWNRERIAQLVVRHGLEQWVAHRL